MLVIQSPHHGRVLSLLITSATRGGVQVEGSGRNEPRRYQHFFNPPVPSVHARLMLVASHFPYPSPPERSRRSGRRWVGTRHEPTDGPCESPVCRSFRSSHSSFVPSVTHSLRSFFPSVPQPSGYEACEEGKERHVSDRQDDERRWRRVTGTVHLLSVIPLPLMSVLTLPTSFLCSLSLLSRSLRLEVRFSLFTSHHSPLNRLYIL